MKKSDIHPPERNQQRNVSSPTWLILAIFVMVAFCVVPAWAENVSASGANVSGIDGDMNGTVLSPLDPEFGGDGNATTSMQPVISWVNVTPVSTEMTVGEVRSFSAAAYDPSGAVVPDVMFSWESSDPSVGTVNGTGSFTARAPGSAVITATVENSTVNGSAAATVTAPLPEVSPTPVGTMEVLSSVRDVFGGVMPDTNNVFLRVANKDGARFNDFGDQTYNIRWTGGPAASPDIDGGQNALHITADPSQKYGQVTYTDNQSGVFWVTDTGGRQYKDEILLLIAVNGTIPNDFRLHLKADGYQWDPNPIPHAPPALEDVHYEPVTLDEWFTKDDLVYGPQTWRPAAHTKYPLYPNQDVYDESNPFMMMLVDLNAGDRYGVSPVRVQYDLENLSTFMAFNAYAYSKNADTGVYNITCWTNRLLGNPGEFSGYYISGSPPMPVAKVVISPSELELPLNGKKIFTATAYDELDREIKGASFVWISTNPEVGTIDGSGLFTPRSIGETEVQAKAGNVSDSAIVKVIQGVEIVLDKISLSPLKLTLYDDDPKVYRFNATGYDQFGDLFPGAVYTWSSSNETVCVVDESGVVEVLRYGNSTISAQNDTVSGKAEVTFKKRPDWTLNLNGATTLSLNRTHFIQLAEKNPASYTDRRQNLWEGLNLSSLVGLVDDNDPSTFNATIAVDKYKIRVKSALNGDAISEFTSDELLEDKTFVVGYKLNGKEIPDEITGGRLYWPLYLHGTGCEDKSIERITDIDIYILPHIREINISPDSINLWDNSEPFKIPIRAFDDAGSVLSDEDYILNYTWGSSNPGVGTVNQSGYFYPAGAGKTTISASIADKSATAEIRVLSSATDRIYVGNSSGDFKTIQGAVDFSHDGDTIVVMNGTYRENVVIDHPVTIISEKGPETAIVERGDQNRYAFIVQASNVTISSLGIKGHVILKDGKYSNLIVDSNIITDGGICLSEVTSNNTIINNSVITAASIKGIDIKSSNYNKVCNNFVSTNMFGLFIDTSSEGHIIADNTFNTSSKCFASRSTFSNNTFLDGGTWSTRVAFDLYGSGNSLTNNTFYSTQRPHAFKLNGRNNIVTGNTFKGGTEKVVGFEEISNVVFYKNNVIKLNASGCLSLYHSSGLKLNSTAPLTYFYNGSEYTGYLGNFWDGFSALDEDGNGVLDAPQGCDYYPLVGPYEDGVIKAPDVMYYPVLIEVAPDDVTIVRGESKRFTATAFDNLGRKVNGATFVWSISNESVGTVDQNGLFSATNKGDATITASLNAAGRTLKGSANVSVIGEYPVLIELTPHNIMMLKGGSREFTAKAFDGLGREVTNVNFIWSVSNEGIGNVYQNGSFSSIGIGNVTITALLNTPDGTVKGFANVSVVEGLPSSMTFSVDDDLHADFSMIEDAVSFARDGDTVIVRDGNYTGNLVVEQRIVLKSEKGPENARLKAGSTIDLRASGATIEGLSFGSLSLGSVDNCVIRNNTLSGSNKYGIYIEKSNACIIENNNLRASSSALYMTGSNGNKVQNNKVTSSSHGITVRGESKNNLISNNTITGCKQGIRLEDPGVTGNTIWNNTIGSCGRYGWILATRYTTGNTFFLNNVSETRRYTHSAQSFWNTTTPVTYLLSGVEHTGYLGNYWKTYSSTDTDGDGVGEDPYVVAGSEIDSHPLVYSPDNYIILKATAIAVSPASATLKVGENVNFTAEIFDLRGEEVPPLNFTWSSSNETVGVVNATTGSFEALSTGNATITASAEGLTGTAQVTVTAQTLTAIEVSPQAADLIIGETQQFTAVAKDQAGTAMPGVDITWSSSNETVGVVNATTGSFDALSPGSATVTASAEGATGTAQVAVTARTLTAIEVSPQAADLIVGETQQFTAVAKDQKGTAMLGVDITWSSNNETVGVVNATTGGFEALSPGGTMVIASAGEATGMVQVTVTARTLTTIEVSPSKAYLAVGDTRQFTAGADDQKGTAISGVDFTWSSSNETVGTIDDNGLFTALKAGNVRVLAKNGSVRGAAEITVISDAQKILYVDDSGGAEYTTIQDALAACSDGDLIVVKDGKYHGSVTVDKRVTIRSENGRASTELYPDESGFVITADGVEVSGITVVNVGGRGNYGIKVLGASDCRITDNRMFACREGILLSEATGNHVENNFIEGVNRNNKALALVGSTSNTLFRNFFKSGRINVDAASTDNRWYSDTVLNYEFKGTVYSSYMGNYFPGYSGADGNGDGIRDEPYVIGGTVTASYPLVSPPANYIVLKPATITVSPTSVTLEVGEGMDFAAEVFDQWGKMIPGVGFTWSSSNEAVGTVNATTGYFEALSAGSTTVTTSAGGVTGTAAVTVKGPSVSTIEVSPATAELTVGDTQQFTATAKDEAGTVMSGIEFIWSSSNETVGAVNAATGHFLALKSGGTTIKATCGDCTASALVTVVPATKKTETVSFEVPDCTFAENSSGASSISVNASAASINGSRLALPGDGFTLTVMTTSMEIPAGGRINATYDGMVLETDPLVADLPIPGTVSGSIRTNLTGLPAGAGITTTLNQTISDEIISAFQLAASGDGLEVDAVAFTMNIVKTNLTNGQEITNASVRMAVSPAWVDAHGGVGAVRIIRWAEDDTKEVLETRLVGTDAGGNLIFEAYSPNGLSLFGLSAVSRPQAEGGSSSSGGGLSDVASFAGSVPEGETRSFSVDRTAIDLVTVEAWDELSDLLVTVEKASLPTGIEMPGSTVYEIEKMTLYRADPSAVAGLVLEFSVPKTWLDAHGLSSSQIALLQYADGGWKSLPTTLLKEDEGKAYYSAEADGFTYFAIVAGEIVAAGAPVPAEETPVPTTEVVQTAETSAPPASTTVPKQSPVMEGLALLAVGAAIMMRRR